jgi:hypothetical protein
MSSTAPPEIPEIQAYKQILQSQELNQVNYDTEKVKEALDTFSEGGSIITNKSTVDKTIPIVNTILSFLITNNTPEISERTDIIRIIRIYFSSSPLTTRTMNPLYGMISNCMNGNMDFSILEHYVNNEDPGKIRGFVNDPNEVGQKYPLDMAFLGKKKLFRGRECLTNTTNLSKIVALIKPYLDPLAIQSAKRVAAECHQNVQLGGYRKTRRYRRTKRVKS